MSERTSSPFPAVSPIPIRRAFRCFAILPLALLALLLSSCAVAQIELESDLVLDLVVDPAERYQGHLALRNIGEETATVRLYKKDYRFNSLGESYFEEPGSMPRSNSNWIELPSTVVRVPAKEVLTLSYAIEVPADPELSGTYWSLIFVENAEEDGDGIESTGFGLRQVVRYGVQVATTIRGSGPAQLHFTKPVLLGEAPEALAFAVDVQNVGEVFVRPGFRLDVYGSGGVHVGSFHSERLRIYPGTSVRAVFDISRMNPGKYHALFIADAGGEDVFGARYSLEISAHSQ